MTIEEKFEKLLERHQALAGSVDLIAKIMGDEDKRQNARIDALITATNQDAENIRALACIAEAHQRRIENLENTK